MGAGFLFFSSPLSLGGECMKKLISVLSVVLVLAFSCVLTSFADDSIVSGYAVDNVPYSDSFDGVLTVSDSGSQLYSSSYDDLSSSSCTL